MSTKKPELSDFGITPKQYALYKDKSADAIGVPLFLVLLVFNIILFGAIVGFSVSVITNGGAIGAIIAGAIASISFGPIVSALVLLLVDRFIRSHLRSRLLKKPVASRIKLYDEAEAAYQRTQREAETARRAAEMAQREAETARRAAERARQEAEEARQRKRYEHWMSLSGAEFERELGTLYRYLDYRVESTPTSGDQGIDLILSKDGRTTIVQCKSHKSPVGPAVARELLGSLVAFGADGAILACTGGFTRGVKEFVRGKPIELISASDLAALGERVESDIQDLTSSSPICPMPGCRRTMILRTGSYGRFWGCPAYPRCKGTRDTAGPCHDQPFNPSYPRRHLDRLAD